MARLPKLLVNCGSLTEKGCTYRIKSGPYSNTGIIPQHLVVKQHDGCPVGYTRCGNITVDRGVDVEGGIFSMDIPHIKCCNDRTEFCVPDDTNPFGGRCTSREDLANKLTQGTVLPELPYDVTRIIADYV